MSRIDATLAALKAQGRKALIPYVMATQVQTSSNWACRLATPWPTAQ
jgi:tryptophan synthase alpha subunit